MRWNKLKKYCIFIKTISKDNKPVYEANKIYPVAFEDNDNYYFKCGTLKNEDGSNRIDFGISKKDKDKLYIVHIESK